MKTLLAIRHAKSTWNNPLYNDFDRPLIDSGHAEATDMVQRLLKRSFVIDAFITSSAQRAFSTAIHFATAYGSDESDIISLPLLYHASPETFDSVISKIDNKHNTIAIFAHNPGITEFVNRLTSVTVDHMPTCGIYAVHAHVDSWGKFASGEKEFLFFDYPMKVG